MTTLEVNAAPRARRRWPYLLAALVVLGVLSVTVISAFDRASPDPADALGDSLWYEVRTGPLTISLNATGALKTKDQVVLRNDLPGKTTIVRLVPEGTQAHKGDVLVELDSSRLDNDIIDQQIKVNTATAELTKSTENLAVVKNQAQSDIIKADADLRNAQINLVKYEEGEYKVAEQKAIAALKLAEATFKQSADKLRWSEILAKDGYIARNEVDADRLTHQKNELDTQTAQIDLEVLRKYTKQQKVQELKDLLTQAQLAVERVKRKASADIAQADADLKAKTTEHERQVAKLDKLSAQLKSTKIIAPIDGIVIYPPSPNPFMAEKQMTEGAEVFERQELIYLPTSSSIIANVLVPEINISKLKVGFPVRITIDAIPGHKFSGKISRVAQFPSRETDWLNRDVKNYAVEIAIDGSNPELRPGQSCQAEMIIDELHDVVYIPVQAVVRIGDQPVVFVPSPTGPRRKPVQIGMDNNRMVHILEGLTRGDRVLLTPPLENPAPTPSPASGRGPG